MERPTGNLKSSGRNKLETIRVKGGFAPFFFYWSALFSDLNSAPSALFSAHVARPKSGWGGKMEFMHGGSTCGGGTQTHGNHGQVLLVVLVPDVCYQNCLLRLISSLVGCNSDVRAQQYPRLILTSSTVIWEKCTCMLSHWR